MPLSSYECLFLLDPTKASTDMDGLKTQIHGTFEKYGADIVASRKWDDRKLAYPIKGHKKGVYHLAYFKVDSLKVTEIDHDFRLNEAILRHMISHIDPKWEDEMQAVAVDETRQSLQIIHEEAPEGGVGRDSGGPPSDDAGEGPPRRGPRRSADSDSDKD